MSDQKPTVVVSPMNNENLVGPGNPSQPFSVTLNLPQSEELAKMLRDVYGPILAETNDFRPLAAYVRSLVSTAVQQSIGHVQQQLTQQHRAAIEQAQATQVDETALEADETL